eukprot:scaffold70082_cov15-Tisochrysis_lutea.AAC.4
MLPKFQFSCNRGQWHHGPRNTSRTAVSLQQSPWSTWFLRQAKAASVIYIRTKDHIHIMQFGTHMHECHAQVPGHENAGSESRTRAWARVGHQELKAQL